MKKQSDKVFSGLYQRLKQRFFSQSREVPRADQERMLADIAEAGMIKVLVQLSIPEEDSDVVVITDVTSQQVLQSAVEDAAANLGCNAPTLTSRIKIPRKKDDPPPLVLIASLSDEDELQRQLLEKNPHLDEERVFRLWSDLYVNKFARHYSIVAPTTAQLLQKQPSPEDARSLPTQAYAIVCTPRTGSTLLMNLLMELGDFGYPREHLRDGVLSLTEFSSFDFTHWLRSVLTEQQSDNGIFGTKIIVEFLLRAEKLIDQDKLHIDEISGVNWKVLRLKRRDVIAQAVSTHLAQSTGVFFERGEDQRKLRRQKLESLEYDYSAINHHHRNIRGQEEALDQLLSRSSIDQLDIEYESLVEDCTRELIRIRQFFSMETDADFTAPGTVISKLDDSISHSICERYRQEHAKRINKQPQQPRPGPYQERDWEVADYEYFQLPDLTYRWRGPKPLSTRAGSFFCTLGAAQTMGRFCTSPYPHLVSRELDVPALNLGYSGAGPSFYLQEPPIFEYLKRASFVVVQVMSGRSAGNSLWQCHTGRNIVRWLPTNEECTSERAFRMLREGWDLDTVKQIIEETRKNWVDDMCTLLERIERPTLLLWMSDRTPEFTERYTAKFYDMLGSFPHLVNTEMIKAIKPSADHYIESVCNEGIPHQLISRFSGNPTDVQFPNGEFRGEDHSYPSPEMHQHAAAALLETIQANPALHQS